MSDIDHGSILLHIPLDACLYRIVFVLFLRTLSETSEMIDHTVIFKEDLLIN
jgi:hypothetical protein